MFFSATLNEILIPFVKSKWSIAFIRAITASSFTSSFESPWP
jgi:hypothetical protein